jgi:hypothetical protein
MTVVLGTIKAINERSSFLGAQTKATDKAIADHCVIIAQHIANHGDVTAADFLVKCMSGGLRTNAIRQWFLDFGGCSWNADKKQFGKKKGFLFNEQVAKENPWYLHTKEAAFKPVDTEALIKATIAKIKKAMGDVENASSHKINKEHLRKLEAILSDSEPHYVTKGTEVGIAPIILSPEATVEQPSVH